MELLIKITSEPIQMARFTQNARLVNSDSVDMERRKAIARHMARRNSTPGVSGAASVTDITRINHAFSQNNVQTPPVPSEPIQNLVSRHPQYSAPAPTTPSPAQMPAEGYAAADAVAMSVAASTPAPATVQRDISLETSSNYTAQRGSFEMRVARGDLTYLPPLVMTIITQRPQVHVEYIGGFNYVPSRSNPSGGNINLFT